MKSIKLIIPDSALTAVLKAIAPVAVHIDITDVVGVAEEEAPAQAPVLAPQPDVMVDHAAELSAGVTITPTKQKIDPKTRGAMGGKKRWEGVPQSARSEQGRRAAEKRWAGHTPTPKEAREPRQPKPSSIGNGAGTNISVADTIMRDFMIGDEPVRLGAVREHLLRLGFNRNSASSAFDTLMKRGDVIRIGEALYQRKPDEPVAQQA